MSMKQPISMWILAWVELIQALCIILTLGHWQPGMREYMLFFCDWFERLNKWEEKH